MEEKFKPFKELLKALREIKYAIEGGGKNNNVGEGNGNDIVLPKYIHGYLPDKSSPTKIECLLEIDYDGIVYDFAIKLQSGAIDHSQLTEEEITNFTEFFQNYTRIPPLPLVDDSVCVYTKEQKDTINKNTIIMEKNGVLLKLNDLVFADLYDFITINRRTTTLNIEKGQYYTIMHPLTYNSMIDAPHMRDLTPIRNKSSV